MQSPDASKTRKALACTQCSVRSVREKRGRRTRLGVVTIRAPNPCVLVVTVLFPVAHGLAGDELHPPQPLHTLVAVHLRQDDACGRAVWTRQRPAAQLLG